MSRTTFMTTLLLVASVLLAIGLFVAGAMWRARIVLRQLAES
jgi:hypothetical protein